MLNLFRKSVLLSLLLLHAPFTQAELTIEITKGVETAIPIAIVPFGWKNPSAQSPSEDLATVIKADLTRSGFFKTLSQRDMLTKPTTAEQVRFRNWQALGQEYLVIGQVTGFGEQNIVEFQLFDVYKSVQLFGYRLTVSNKELRRTAHHISNLVYEKLTGNKGVFNTRIAYVTSISKGNKQKNYKLVIADADGYNPRSIASSIEPLMSPAWSADGKQIAYVSFENKRSAIYIQNLASGKRRKVASFRGINGAPAFSPDGAKLAMTLSKDGSPDIYVLNLSTQSLIKITRSYGIETEATWSPDGRTIVYTSDQGGKPQLYAIPSTGGRSQRLTFAGDYNAAAQFSNDGKSLVMVHANQGDYRIATMDLKTRTMNVLTAGPYDESPSFSPNSNMVLYSAKKGSRSILSAVSIDGKMQQGLSFSHGEVREPAWSP